MRDTIRRLLILSAVAAIALSALVAACGGGNDNKSNSSSNAGPDVAPTRPPAAATGSAASSAAPALQTVALKAGERGEGYYFSQSEIKLKPGQVKVTMTNDGPERPHNFVVRNLNGQGDLVATDRLNPGQSVEVSFTVVAGTYNFLCTLPGHADRGAKGTIVVAN